MKNLFIVLALVTMTFACKDEELPLIEPDYADAVVGTYIGTEQYATPSPGNTVYDNPSKTLVVTKEGKNKIQVNSFYSGVTPFFNLSGGSSIAIAPESPLEKYGNSNVYTVSSKILRIDFKNPSTNEYWSFTGTKQ